MSILVLGEFPNLNEELPFSNGYWRYFKLKLAQAGIAPADCHYINVFNKPAASSWSFVQESKSGSAPNIGALGRKQYIRMEFAAQVDAVRKYIRTVRPNLVLACGNIATLVAVDDNLASRCRGRITAGLPSIDGVKVLPCYHPRDVLQDEKNAPVFLADLHKAKRESVFPELRRPQRWLHLRPSVDDLEEFWQQYIASAKYLSIDIEAKGDIITCVGVAPSKDRALVIPFFDEEQKSGNYWEQVRDERIAWQFVARCCAVPHAEIVGQNFSYDAMQLWKRMGIASPAWRHDTMILHHALQIEMRKSLGFQASIYSDELAWKFLLHKKADDKSGKKEDDE